jgi:diguanylate cyclase (GGDEF)-like protein
MPFGIYIFNRDYSIFSSKIEKTIDDVETLLDWTIKKERLLLEDFFDLLKKNTKDNVYQEMNSNLKNFTDLSANLFLDEKISELKKVIESLSLKYPIYLKSANGIIIASSKGMPSVREPFNGDKEPFFIKDLNSDKWVAVEKEIKNGLFRFGTLVKQRSIQALIEKHIIDFVKNNEDTGLEIFILDMDGNFLANESGVFPGRAISEKLQKERANQITESILKVKNNPEGSIVEYLWEIPEIKFKSLQRKRFFIKYDEELDWIIGIGMGIEGLYDYEEFEFFKLNKIFKKGIIEYFLFILALFFILLLGGIYIGRKISRGFDIFQRFIERANTTHEPINCSVLTFEEFRKLGKIANEMVDDRKKQKEIILAYMNKLKSANKKLKDKSDRDGLTGIHNRGYFDDALKKAWQDAVRHEKPVSVGMIDIDFFKQYNDTYGHQMGDECLITIAACISSVMKRPYDLAARYGGEEFVVLFPDTDSKGALKLAVMIQKSIAEQNIEHKASKVSSSLTFSMGLATIIPDRETLPEIIIKKADDALYKAKKAGRNRIVSV